MNEKEVEYNEGLTLACEINAFFKAVSSKECKGIDDLFNSIGKKFLNPSIDISWFLEGEDKKIYDKINKRRKEQKINKKLIKYLNF